MELLDLKSGWGGWEGQCRHKCCQHTLSISVPTYRTATKPSELQPNCLRTELICSHVLRSDTCIKYLFMWIAREQEGSEMFRALQEWLKAKGKSDYIELYCARQHVRDPRADDRENGQNKEQHKHRLRFRHIGKRPICEGWVQDCSVRGDIAHSDATQPAEFARHTKEVSTISQSASASCT
jgi:hypothetical protein